MDINPIDDIIDGVRGIFGDAASAAGEAVLEVVMTFVFGLLASAVTAITSSIITAMDATTGVDLDGGFFPALTPIRRTVLGMSTVLILALFLLAVLRSLAAGEPGAIVRTALVDVPAAIATTVLSVAVAWILIRVVDQASLAVTGDVAGSMGRFSAALSTADALSGAGLLGMIFGVLFILGAILVWLQLLVRSAMLYVLVVLAPLGFATRAHPATRAIARRTIEIGIALILSKFAVAVAFGVGAAAIDSSNPVGGGEADLTGMMTGVAVMLMAAFMPWVIWKAIPMVESAAVTAGVERAPGHAVMTAASIGIAAGATASKLAGATTTSQQHNTIAANGGGGAAASTAAGAVSTAATMASRATGATSESSSPRSNGAGESDPPRDTTSIGSQSSKGDQA